MKRVTVQFSSLTALSNCMYELGINKPTIDYGDVTVIVDLTPDQLTYCISQCKAVLLKELDVQK